jgi:outer membrane protein insertion porin family
MRFSPTLLACCTVAALAGLPARAETVANPVQNLSDSLIADAAPSPDQPPNQTALNRAPVEPAVTAPDPVAAGEAGSSPSNQAELQNLTPALVPSVAQNEGEDSGNRLQRLLEGIPQRQTDPSDTSTPVTPETPTPETPAPETPTSPPPEAETPPEETRVLVAEVAVATPDGDPLPPELVDAVYDAVETQPGRTTTRSALQSDINNVFGTGYFSNVRAVPEDTALGVRVTFLVDPNPVLTEVQVRDNQVLSQDVVNEIFSPQYGRILNLIDFQDGILELNDWYQQNGYVLAQVTAAPQVSDDGVVTLIVAEGVIEDIEVRYITAEGDTEDEEGNPIQGRTRPFIVTREFESQPGDVFQQTAIQSDLERVFGLGIFDDVRLSLDPGDEDPRKVKVVVNVAERSTGSIGAAVGFNLTGDIFGSVSYQQDNFGGNNQKLRGEVQLSARDLLFDVSFTDPWIAGDPNRTSYTVNAFNRRSISLIFDNGPTPVALANGDTPRINRFGGGVSFSRPFGESSSGSVGFNYQRISSRDGGGTLSPVDGSGAPLTFSAFNAISNGRIPNQNDARDDLLTIPVSYAIDRRNDAAIPTSGSLLRLGTEQSIPLGNGSIFFNRLRASYSYYIPVSFLSFGEGPQSLAFNVQGGTVLGDLPPYEAFSLGGTNSVRGYEEGDMGSGRSYLQASAEYRFPLFTSFLGGAFFFDVGTDLGSGDSVPGNPVGIRGKPGSGFGYGAGIRVQTPLGALRLDYGFNDEGNSRIHFGIGERF